jgi:hypothetical protein
MDKPQKSERQISHARRYPQDQSAGPAAGEAITRIHAVDRGLVPGREASMAAIAIIIGTFVAGAAAGIVVIVSLGIRREERDLTLTGRAPDRKSRGLVP